MLFIRTAWASLALCLSTTSCRSFDSLKLASAPNVDAATFDVNDVSLAFPKPTAATLSRYVQLEGLLGTSDFSTLISSASLHNPSPLVFDPKAWLVIGARFEPCAKGRPTLDACTVEFRLIAQPFNASTGNFLDHAFHLIYRFPAEMAPQIRAELLRLKSANRAINTNGVPLGIHPIMAAEAMDGPFASGLIAMVRDVCRRDRLRIATATLEAAGSWKFTKAESPDGGPLTLVNVPFVDGKEILFTNINGTFGSSISLIKPKSTAPDNVNRIIDSGRNLVFPNLLSSFARLPAEEQARDIAMALRLDNPTKHGSISTDCVSCHVATRALVSARGETFATGRGSEPDRYAIPEGITGANASPVDTLADPYEARAFGWNKSGEHFIVSQHTINSSAEVAAQLNAVPHSVAHQGKSTKP